MRRRGSVLGPMAEMTWEVKFGSYRPAPLRVSSGSRVCLLVDDMMGGAGCCDCFRYGRWCGIAFKIGVKAR